MAWKAVVIIKDGTAYGAFGSDGSAVISATLRYQLNTLHISYLGPMPYILIVKN